MKHIIEFKDFADYEHISSIASATGSWGSKRLEVVTIFNGEGTETITEFRVILNNEFVLASKNIKTAIESYNLC